MNAIKNIKNKTLLRGMFAFCWKLDDFNVDP